jgi:hypothetical protein
MTELRAGGEGLLVLRSRDLSRNVGEELGLAPSRRRPCPKTGAVPQPTGGAKRQRRPRCIPFREGAPGRGDEPEGHGQAAELGLLVRLDRRRQQRPSLVEVTSPHGDRGQLRSRRRLEPIVVELATELVDLGEVRASSVESAERGLHHPDRQRGKRHERLVLLTKCVERVRRRVQRALEVVD